MIVRTSSHRQTHRLGRRLGECLATPRTLLLSGELGSGKTALSKGLAEGLGIDPEEVHSPTFSLIHFYEGGRCPLYHVDLYRLEGLRDQMSIGLEEVLESPGVVVVEWAERLRLKTDPPLEINIQVEGSRGRSFVITGLSPEEAAALSGANPVAL